jgi:hypothetical protein
MTVQDWYHSEDLIASSSSTLDESTVEVDDVYGYVLPHAGTKYTGDIIQHTCRFRPKNVEVIKRVYIYYYPANEKPDVILPRGEPTANNDDDIIRLALSASASASASASSACHHELYVPFRTILHYFRQWNVNTTSITFIPVNIRDIFTGRRGGGDRTRTFRQNKSRIPQRSVKYRATVGTNRDFFIISADFSHHKPFQYAIPAENKAAHAIVTGSLNSRNGNSTSHDASYLNEIDDTRTFRAFMRRHPNLSFQWIGRTRSPGESAVGYLTFLIRPVFQPSKSKSPIDGIFVTCYDSHMNARECLGEWFSGDGRSGASGGVSWSRGVEDEFIRKVKVKAQTESRLTGGKGANLPITRCVITYLFKDHDRNHSTNHSFIRGWHSIQTNAIYLPDVLLEHAKEDGSWIAPRDTTWNITTNNSNNSNNRFQLTETLEKLDEKAGGGGGGSTNTTITLYTTRICVKKY